MNRCPDPVLNKLRIFGVSILVALGCIGSVYMAIASAESQVCSFSPIRLVYIIRCLDLHFLNQVGVIFCDISTSQTVLLLQASTYSIIIKVVSSAVQFNALAVNFNFRAFELMFFSVFFLSH